MSSEPSPDEIKRYSRQLILSSWSSKTQETLNDETVVISSLLPSTLLYLAAAGVGKIFSVDVLGGDSSPWLKHASQLNAEISITGFSDDNLPTANVTGFFIEDEVIPEITPEIIFVQIFRVPQDNNTLQGGAEAALRYLSRFMKNPQGSN